MLRAVRGPGRDRLVEGVGLRAPVGQRRRRIECRPDHGADAPPVGIVPAGDRDPGVVAAAGVHPVGRHGRVPVADAFDPAAELVFDQPRPAERDAGLVQGHLDEAAPPRRLALAQGGDDGAGRVEGGDGVHQGDGGVARFVRPVPEHVGQARHHLDGGAERDPVPVGPVLAVPGHRHVDDRGVRP